MPILALGWTRDGDRIAGCPAVVVIDRTPKILAGTAAGHLVALDGTGAEVWRRTIGARVSAWPVVDEAPGVGRQGRALQAMNGRGEMLWSRFDYLGGDQSFGPSIADVDGDHVRPVASSKAWWYRSTTSRRDRTAPSTAAICRRRKWIDDMIVATSERAEATRAAYSSKSCFRVARSSAIRP